MSKLMWNYEDGWHFVAATELPRLLIIGHARHGKDTAAEYLRDEHGYKFASSSAWCGINFLWPVWGKNLYDSPQAMLEDSGNHRPKWAELISEFNTPDKVATVRGMFHDGFRVYVGMRKRDEFEAAMAGKWFDHVMWIDRSAHLPDEPSTSMELTREDANVFIDNNGSLAYMHAQLTAFTYSVQR